MDGGQIGAWNQLALRGVTVAGTRERIEGRQYTGGRKPEDRAVSCGAPLSGCPIEIAVTPHNQSGGGKTIASGEPIQCCQLAARGDFEDRAVLASLRGTASGT